MNSRELEKKIEEDKKTLGSQREKEFLEFCRKFYLKNKSSGRRDFLKMFLPLFIKIEKEAGVFCTEKNHLEAAKRLAIGSFDYLVLCVEKRNFATSDKGLYLNLMYYEMLWKCKEEYENLPSQTRRRFSGNAVLGVQNKRSRQRAVGKER
jgi:hypothetical protein